MHVASWPVSSFSCSCLDGFQVLEFGTVCVNSVRTKSFSVANDLEQNILVSIDVENIEELKQSSPLSQMVPPGKVAGFDMKFCSPIIQEKRVTVNYTINEQHTFNFTVTAEVPVVVLSLSLRR